jgi:hypothetical protein
VSARMDLRAEAAVEVPRMVLQFDASFTQRALAVVVDQRELAGENVEEFIFLLMPVAQRRASLERM